MSPLVDFNSVDKEYEAIPNTRGLPAAFDSYESGWTMEHNKPKYDLTFVCTEGEYQGRKFFTTLTLEGPSLMYFRRTMIALGAEPSDFKGDEVDTDEIIEQAVGAGCLLDIVKQQYEGVWRNKVKNVRALTFAMSPSSF